MDYVDRKLGFFSRNVIISLSIIGIIGFFFRLSYFTYEIPVTLDSLYYFVYATDISILGHFPNYTLANNGWPIFLSFFFSLLHSYKLLDYMAIQRLITISISVLTIIPVYMLCSNFSRKYAILGAAIFAFEPRIVQNSTYGLADPLYIILGAITLVLFLSSSKKFVYLSFAVAALSAMVRSEGLVLFLPLSVVFLIRFKKEKRVILKYAFAATIFILVLLPMIYYKTEVNSLTVNPLKPAPGDQLFKRIYDAVEQTLTASSREKGGPSFFNYMFESFVNLVKYLGWTLIPIFVIFTPLGGFLIFKNRDYKKMTIILATIFMLIPALYALTVAADTRYFYFLYPMFCVMSLFTVERIDNKIKKSNIILAFLIGGILFGSYLFLDYKMDIQHEKDTFSIAKRVNGTITAINPYPPEDRYYMVAGIPDRHNFRETYDPKNNLGILDAFSSFPLGQPKFIPIDKAKTLEEYIENGRKQGLTHLVLDGKKSRLYFFNNVFYNEDKYPYLIKIFDSWDYGYKYHVKIYKIDYERFDRK